MAQVFGLVVVDVLEVETSIPPHEISLIGKPIVMHSLEGLGAVCDSVTVEPARQAGEPCSEVVRRALLRLRPEVDRDEESSMIIQDAFQPLLRHELLDEIRSELRSGAVAVATVRRNPVPEDRTNARREEKVEAPAGFRLRELAGYLRQGARRSESIGRLASSLASDTGTELRLVPRSHCGGRLFEDLSLDEAEALLRVGATTRGVGHDRAGEVLRRVLVLGGTGGIGTACLKLLGEQGINYDAPTRQELDLIDEKDFDCLWGVDAVIHTAGAYGASAEEIMEVNFHSCVRLLEAAERKAWKGRMMFLSSTAATFGRAGAPVYSASKAALNSLIEAQAGRLAECGICLVGVAPAKVSTTLQKKLNPETPTDQMISPEYVAHFVLRALRQGQAGNIIYLRKGEDT